jgi:hypothetical protein
MESVSNPAEVTPVRLSADMRNCAVLLVDLFYDVCR